MTGAKMLIRPETSDDFLLIILASALAASAALWFFSKSRYPKLRKPAALTCAVLLAYLPFLTADVVQGKHAWSSCQLAPQRDCLAARALALMRQREDFVDADTLALLSAMKFLRGETLSAALADGVLPYVIQLGESADLQRFLQQHSHLARPARLQALRELALMPARKSDLAALFETMQSEIGSQEYVDIVRQIRGRANHGAALENFLAATPPALMERMLACSDCRSIAAHAQGDECTPQDMEMPGLSPLELELLEVVEEMSSDSRRDAANRVLALLRANRFAWAAGRLAIVRHDPPGAGHAGQRYLEALASTLAALPSQQRQALAIRTLTTGAKANDIEMTRFARTLVLAQMQGKAAAMMMSMKPYRRDAALEHLAGFYALVRAGLHEDVMDALEGSVPASRQIEMTRCLSIETARAGQARDVARYESIILDHRRRIWGGLVLAAAAERLLHPESTVALGHLMDYCELQQSDKTRCEGMREKVELAASYEADPVQQKKGSEELRALAARLTGADPDIRQLHADICAAAGTQTRRALAYCKHTVDRLPPPITVACEDFARSRILPTAPDDLLHLMHPTAGCGIALQQHGFVNALLQRSSQLPATEQFKMYLYLAAAYHKQAGRPGSPRHAIGS